MELKQPVKIYYIKGAMGYRQDNNIFLHEDLKLAKYEKLHKAILEHELAHVDKITLKDFWMDLNPGFPRDELRMFKKEHKEVIFRMMSPINRF